MPCDIRSRIDSTRIVNSTVGDINLGILRQVAEEIAVLGKGRVTDSAKMLDGRTVTSNIGITISTLEAPYGVALQVVRGSLSFEGSSSQPGFDKVARDVPNAYVDKVIESGLRSLQYFVAKNVTDKGITYTATDMSGRQFTILRRPDSKMKIDFGDGYDDATYHEVSDALKKVFASLGVETSAEWSHPERPEKWLEQRVAVLGKDN